MAKRRTDLPPSSEFRALLDYDPVTGLMTFKERPASMFTAARYAQSWNKRFAGKPAMNVQHFNGYLIGEVLGRVYSAHRLAWYMTHGVIPNEIDHINGVRTDNRLANLRAVTRTENCRNTQLSALNTSGVSGVVWDKSNSKWIARVNHKFLGRFVNFDDAVAARKAAEVELGYHPNHGRISAPDVPKEAN